MRTDTQSNGFSGLYAELRAELAQNVCEPSSAYPDANQGVREEVVRCLWFGSHFSPDQLRTDDGRRVEVLSPGWWNVEAGPDFLRAEVLLEGAGHMVGDVEVHTFASGWKAHGHDCQASYDDVILHVVLWNDLERKTVRLASGQDVPQLTLSDFVEDEIGDLIDIVDVEKDVPAPESQPRPVAGRYCGEAVEAGKLSLDWIGCLLDCAGDHRVLARCDALDELSERVPRDQLLHERLADALGFKNNRLAFRQLASLAPLALLRTLVPIDADAATRLDVLDAILFGSAGMLPEDTAGMDAETAAYTDRLRGIWDRMPAEIRADAMSPAHWTVSGTRPTNYPARRIAAFSALCELHLESGLLVDLVRTLRAARVGKRRREDVALRRALLDVFTGLEHPYWSRRYSFGGRRLAQGSALIGEERATAILVDVLVPALLSLARADNDGEQARRLQLIWAGLPLRTPNTVVRRMAEVMFPDADTRGTVTNTRRQQGLHQLYRDFCSTDGGCTQCIVYLAQLAGRQFPAG